MRRWAGIIGGALFAIAAVNFTAFFILSLSWGGDAISGKVEDGSYYLSLKGKLTEVSERPWRMSRIHTISIWITHPLAIFVGAPLMAYADRRKK